MLAHILRAQMPTTSWPSWRGRRRQSCRRNQVQTPQVSLWSLTSTALKVTLERAELGQAKGLLPAADWVPICEYSVTKPIVLKTHGNAQELLAGKRLHACRSATMSAENERLVDECEPGSSRELPYCILQSRWPSFCTWRLRSPSVSDPADINSLSGIAESVDVVREATNKVGLQRLPDLDRMQPNGGTLIQSCAKRQLSRCRAFASSLSDSTQGRQPDFDAAARRQSSVATDGPIPARLDGKKNFEFYPAAHGRVAPPRLVRATVRASTGGIPTCVPQKSVDRNPCSSAARTPNRLS